MKYKSSRLLLLGLILVLAISACKKPSDNWSDVMAVKLSNLPNVVSVTREESLDFAAKYKVFFKQPVNHDNPFAGTFCQLVYVCMVHPDSLNVLITEGYYAFDAKSKHELANMLNGNQIVVEHRYYGESVIDDPYFLYNDAESSCDDLHEVVKELKQLLSGKWISTGGSKSGLTCNMYRAFYPYDVDVTVPYGSPFCESRYDGRMAQALTTKIGSAEDRAKMTAFKREVLRRRDVMAHKLDSAATAQGISFRLSPDEMLDLHIMDFEVAFWAFSYDIDEMPATNASDDEIFDYIMSVDGPDAWDSHSDVNKYYIEAYMELGHYACSTAGIEDLLVVDDYILQDYLKYIYVPDGISNAFSTEMHQYVDAFLRQTDAKYIFIYGDWDPWCAVGVGPEYERGNIHRYVLPMGSHHARISNFNPAAQYEIKSLLNAWLR